MIRGATQVASTTTPDAVAPPPHHPRFPLLDGLRAIAALSVLVLHVANPTLTGDSITTKLAAHLDVGVTIFFLLSGFLLYRPLIAKRTGGAAAPRDRDYAKRRFLRIYPAYWLVLAVLIAVPGLTAVPGNGGFQQFALLHTLPIGDGTACLASFRECGVAQTWSLAVEVTFYAVLPVYALIAAALARRRPTRQWLSMELALLSALAAASAGLRYSLLYPVGIGSFVGGTVVGFVVWFALGMALALISVAVGNDHRHHPRVISALGAHPGSLWLLAIVIYVLLSLGLPPTSFLVDRSDQVVVHLGFGLIATLLMLPAVFGDQRGGWPRTILGWRPVAWLGLISYGIFLWHFVVTIELGGGNDGLQFLPLLLVTIALTVPLSAASYYLVERPLLRLKYRKLPVQDSSAARLPRR